MARESTKLSETGLKQFLDQHGGWSVKEGQLQRTYEFGAFLDTIAFVQKVAAAAEQADHHPDIDIRWRKVTLRLFTHDAKALTTRDAELAAECDALR